MKNRFSGSTLGNGRWDEEEHPRGKDGRFTSGGGEAPEGDEDVTQKKIRESLKIKDKDERRAAIMKVAKENARNLRERRERELGEEELKGSGFSYGEEVHWQNGSLKFSGNVVGRRETGVWKVKEGGGKVIGVNGKIYKKGEEPKFVWSPFGKIYL